jgi:hypothetical protein
MSDSISHVEQEKFHPELASYGVLVEDATMGPDFLPAGAKRTEVVVPKKLEKSENIEKKVETAEFILNPEVKHYIFHLIKESNPVVARRLGILGDLDLRYASSPDDAKSILEKHLQEKTLTPEQHKKLVALVENKDEEVLNEVIAEPVATTPPTPELLPDTPVETLAHETPVIDTNKSVEARGRLLKNTHGIVVEGAGGYTEIEKRIQEKFATLWNREEDKSAIVYDLFALGEDVQSAVSSLEQKTPEKIPEKMGEEETLHAEFLGQLLEVVFTKTEGGKMFATVRFGGKTIAEGSVTNSASDIKLKKDPKSGIFSTVDPITEKAYKKALSMAAPFITLIQQ